MPPLLLSFSSLNVILNQAIASVVPFINHGKGPVGLRVLKSEEGVIHQIHLKHRFFHRHQLNREALGADNLELILFRLRGKSGDLLYVY